jgi:hypothetical protein
MPHTKINQTNKRPVLHNCDPFPHPLPPPPPPKPNKPQAETLLTSVERLHHYTTLPPEGEARNPSYLPPPGWPDRGEIEVRDLHVRYREDLPTVLHGVGFTIPAGRKVGVVGRTGSGKSSFLAALLRLNEIVQGDIVVDGVSLTRLGLADARTGVVWIPQSPDLFAGTLRCVRGVWWAVRVCGLVDWYVCKGRGAHLSP